MITAITEDLWNGRDNVVVIQILEDLVPKDMTAVTRIVITVGSTVVDSDTSPTAITWEGATGKVTLKLGGESIPDGTHACELVAYDPINSNGVMLIHKDSDAQLTLVARTD